MKRLSLSHYALSVCVAAMLPAGCESQSTGPTTLPADIPRQSQQTPQPGTYVNTGPNSSATQALGYRPYDGKNKGPFCATGVAAEPPEAPSDIAADPQGNVVVTTFGSVDDIFVFPGPAMCNSASFGLDIQSSSGEPPNDIATLNALEGPIYFATDDSDTYSTSNVQECFKVGSNWQCIAPYGEPWDDIGIAVDRNGNVFTTSFTQGLTVWRAGSQYAMPLFGFANRAAGGLAIDKSGNILAVDPYDFAGHSALRIYNHCTAPSGCTVFGPFPFKHLVTYAKLEQNNKTLLALAYTGYAPVGLQDPHVEVYAYHGTNGINYQYSFSNGLEPSDIVSGGIATTPAINPGATGF